MKAIILLIVTVDEPLDLVEEHGDPDNYDDHPDYEIKESLDNAAKALYIDGCTISVDYVDRLKEDKDSTKTE